LTGTVNISDFINHLQAKGLIIVSKDDYERKIDVKAMELKKLQQKMLSKQYLTIGEILKAELFDVKTHQSIKNWINKGFIKSDYVLENKRGQTIIISAEIKRIRELKNLEL